LATKKIKKKTFKKLKKTPAVDKEGRGLKFGKNWEN
jgi:hypothetical protein